jgi:hypothetical protein
LVRRHVASLPADLAEDSFITVRKPGVPDNTPVAVHPVTAAEYSSGAVRHLASALDGDETLLKGKGAILDEHHIVCAVI